jgi:hypothetical protein
MIKSSGNPVSPGRNPRSFSYRPKSILLVSLPQSLRVLILAALAASLSGCAHSRIPGLADPEYRSLLPYEGLYEYENGFTLQMAASPKEKILFAIVAGARYPLHAAGPDSFTDPQKQRVVFQRSSSRVIGYSLPDGSSGRAFRRLGSGSSLPAEA